MPNSMVYHINGKEYVKWEVAQAILEQKGVIVSWSTLRCKRWKKWLQAVKVDGSVYYSREAIAQFHREDFDQRVLRHKKGEPHAEH